MAFGTHEQVNVAQTCTDAPARETGRASWPDGQQPVVEPLQPAPGRRWSGRRFEFEAVTVLPVDELKRSRVVDGKIRTVTNAQYGRLLQLIEESNPFAHQHFKSLIVN